MKTHESEVIGVSSIKRQVAIKRTDETCREGDPAKGELDSEIRTAKKVLRIYDHRGALVRTFDLATADATAARYLARHAFQRMATKLTSPNGRCAISGTDDKSKTLRVRRGKRTLFRRSFGNWHTVATITPYWFISARLLILHVTKTTNPGHYAQHSTSSMMFLAETSHGLKHCY